MCVCARACVYIRTRACISFRLSPEREEGGGGGGGSRSPSYDLPPATFVFASAQHTSQIGCRATLYPYAGVYSGGRTRRRRRHTRDERGRALDRGMDATGCREMRACIHTTLSLSLFPFSFPSSPFIAFPGHLCTLLAVDTSSLPPFLCYLDTP